MLRLNKTSPVTQSAVPSTRSLHDARAATDGLFKQISNCALYERPIPERHRLIFYRGHLEAFDWNLMGKTVLSRSSGSEELDVLFAFGIDPPVGEARSDEPIDWPSINVVEHYIQATRERIDAILSNVPDDALQMAIEHRWMHRETLAYLLHRMPYHQRENYSPARVSSAGGQESVRSRMIRISAGMAVLGRDKGSSGTFGWDNEFPRYELPVKDFSISKFKVSNGEYLEFVNAGGEPSAFWVKRGDDWRYRGLFGEVPLPLAFPVYVTRDQAESYAAWRGAKLPTEAQFQRAAYGDEGETQRFPWGNAPLERSRANANFSAPDLVGVQENPEGDSVFGVSQLVGNGWEWTRTPFAPFPGFQSHPWYAGYSEDFFDGQHFVVKGASPVTAECLIRPTFRNWFRSDYPYAYVSFRLVED